MGCKESNQTNKTLYELIETFILACGALLHETKLFRKVCCKSRIFCEDFDLANSVKRHTCNVQNSRLMHDLPISVKDRVILPFHKGFIFGKLRIC